MNTILQETFTKATEVLKKNLYEVTLNNIHYRRTVPSREFYIHQWNWDSATHAMGLIHIDEDRAFDEIRALISGQWDNGLIAQITFNPNETKYFPGPQFWGTEAFAKGEIMTSGITQPPLLAISVKYIYQHAKNREKAELFLQEVLPALIKYHTYLKIYRDPEDSGLLTVIHPWEAGTDNSPRFDSLLARIDVETIPDEVKVLVNTYRSDSKLGDSSHRPGLTDYYRYMYLVHLFKEWQWDYRKIVQESPFALKDILFNSLWCVANEALSELISDDNSNIYSKWSEQTRQALITCFDEKTNQYMDIDVTQGRHESIKQNTIATFLPLWARATNPEILEKLLTNLIDNAQYWTSYPLPTTALNNPVFELTRYWRGPTWPITNLFVIEGLNQNKENPHCLQIRDELIQKTCEMISLNGFYEYFDPTLGDARPDKKEDTKALGFGSFSWTAAIYVYLMKEYLNN